MLVLKNPDIEILFVITNNNTIIVVLTMSNMKNINFEQLPDNIMFFTNN